MDNTIDFFRDTCKTFRITPEAEKYICGKNKVMESLPDCVSKTFSQDWSNKVPTLNPKDTIFTILKRAEDSVGSTAVGENTLLSILNIEQRFTTAEVIIVTEKDNGNIIPVYNRNWLLLSAENKSKHSIITECEIPVDPIPNKNKNKNENENEDVNDLIRIKNSLLGCYIQDSGTVFLWIDRISLAANKNNMDTELLFQKVLLHELIHAILDCCKRDDKLNVCCPDDNVNGLEETLDNILVLKCYKEICNQSFFNSINKFISTQPSNYALASKVFEKIGHLCIQFEGFISIFLSCKISGTVKRKNPYMYYVCNDIDEDSIEKNSIRDIIDHAVECTGVTDCKKNSYLQSSYDEFQSLCISDILDFDKDEGYAIKIDGEWYDACQIDFISEITVKNSIPEKIINAVIILKNLERSDFISMTLSFYNIDKKAYMGDLSINNMPKTQSGAYLISSREDVSLISRLLNKMCDTYHWTYSFMTHNEP